ncbi:magnesium/cobalt transporter CorA [Tenacibaculum singaporense]|uniref:magnesium/cobalt transporter CorA n=1 Tax=Tenacibaculum singaporense TaxID=2358479 RepID=UPI000F662CCE|nr:magnesium/cobalt transporter CorA [Tenacibaculum singaporense]RSC95999.1 magnesium/cobalt transporter CorA [Tenacibaculum singaporense]
MTRFITKQKSATKNVIPGSPVFVGNRKEENIRIRLIGYDEDIIEEIELQAVSELTDYLTKYKRIWINIDGLHDVELIREVGRFFEIHTLILEDIANTGQRPKVDIEENYIFTSIKMMFLNKEKHQLEAEQVSMYLLKNTLITFQERQGDVFEPVRERLRNKTGRVRNYNTTYLKYCLLDVIVDNYNFLMETFGEKVEDLEDKILLQPNKNTLQEINKYKIELNYFRKAIRPAREAINSFRALKTELITKKEQPFFNDLNDLVQRSYDSVENYKSMLSEQLTVYSTNVNNRLNDIMKILTIFSVVFIPITFIAGIYGTNFEYIPELRYRSGYFVMWGVILLTVLIMLGYFKYKKWF